MAHKPDLGTISKRIVPQKPAHFNQLTMSGKRQSAGYRSGQNSDLRCRVGCGVQSRSEARRSQPKAPQPIENGLMLKLWSMEAACAHPINEWKKPLPTDSAGLIAVPR